MARQLIEFHVDVSDIVSRINRTPDRVREALENKMQTVLGTMKANVLSTKPGKYLDPSTIPFGVETTRDAVIGFIESHNKGGVYTILPIKARALRFVAKSGDLVFRKAVYQHPYPKGAKPLINALVELKPWIEEQLREAVRMS